MGYDAPYKGLKVVDISQGISGPYIGMLMAQYRADVVKVEPLEREWVQLISRDYDKHSVFSVSAILGKRGLATCSYNRFISWIDHQGIGRVPLSNIPVLRPFSTNGAGTASLGIGEHSHEILHELDLDKD